MFNIKVQKKKYKKKRDKIIYNHKQSGLLCFLDIVSQCVQGSLPEGFLQSGPCDRPSACPLEPSHEYRPGDVFSVAEILVSKCVHNVAIVVIEEEYSKGAVIDTYPLDNVHSTSTGRESHQLCE